MNAATLGVRWMAPSGATESSPVVAWNAKLKEPVVYSGNTAGYLNAMDAQTGSIIWSVPFSSPVVSTPIVDQASVWVAPESSGHIYKLDSATGSIECSASVPGTVYATPVIATPPGGHRTIYIATLGQGTPDGLVYAFSTADCSPIFTWNGYTTPGQDTGVWSPISYNIDRTGRPLILFGSANPDSSVYAVNAVTGATAWTFDTDNPAGEDWDVGAGVDTTAPGVNGFSGGVAYVVGKNGICYALDLTTGALIWSYDFGQGSNTDALSTPALAGTTLVFGYKQGILALDALTGKLLWQWSSGGDDINSSPLVAGPTAERVVAFGTVDGVFHVLSLASGTSLYSYSTGSYIVASPADFDGTFLVNSADGFLYDFGLGGGNGASPTTDVGSPETGSVVTNPDGNLTVSGSATAPDGVAAVTVAIQESNATGPWYHANTGSFRPGMSYSDAVLARPGATSTTWAVSIPVPEAGASYLVEASAVDTDGLADSSSATGGPAPSVSTFTVEPDPTAPTVDTSDNRVAPGSNLTVSGTGFMPGESVRFTVLVGGTKTKVLGVSVANATGVAGPVVASIPDDEPFGPQPISATGETSGRSGSRPIFVSNNSPELGYVPQRSEFEPNDSEISNRQSVGPNFFVRGWSFSASGSIDSTPAVDQGVAYIGDQKGNFYAITVADGQGLWASPIGSPISSSPAVDQGLVFFGDQAGSLIALSATTGAIQWTDDLHASISSAPVVHGGDVLVVTSTGTVVAVTETSGIVRWSRSVGSSTTASLSLDPSTGTVVVGSDTGTITALSVKSGSVRWTRTVGGSISATPGIAGKDVFVGSSDGTLLALNEESGATDWQQSVAGSITSLVATPQGLGIGSTDGSVYNFTLAGKPISSQAIGSPVEAITATDNIYLLATQAGLTLVRGADERATINWQYAAPSDYKSPVVILNGELFVAGADGSLRTFVLPGNPVY
jgi:outer membrane protein assembly factor BamB